MKEYLVNRLFFSLIFLVLIPLKTHNMEREDTIDPPNQTEYFPGNDFDFHS